MHDRPPADVVTATVFDDAAKSFLCLGPGYRMSSQSQILHHGRAFDDSRQIVQIVGCEHPQMSSGSFGFRHIDSLPSLSPKCRLRLSLDYPTEVSTTHPLGVDRDQDR